MRYMLPDGNTVTGRSYEDIVAQMSQGKLAPIRSLRSYRKATADRVRSLFGFSIDWQDSKSFVRSMVDAGLLKKLS